MNDKSFFQLKKIHMIGITGAGMAALAELLVKNGVEVTGSDTDEVFFTNAVLDRLGIAVRTPYDPANIPRDAELAVYSTAYNPETNAELKAALEGEVRTISYPEALGELMKEKYGLAVCGTHGKTTTSALLAEVLREAGEDPSAIIGSRILQWDGGALAGKGKYFVLEADEYQNKFQHYTPLGVILTSLDWDHPDFFPTFQSYRQVFADMVKKIPHHGVLVSWGDSVEVGEVAAAGQCQKLAYGFVPANDFQIVHYRAAQAEGEERDPSTAFEIRQTFEVLHEGESLGEFALQLAGKHNALNATAVIALCTFLKIDIEHIRQGLRNFAGTERRFEYIGEYRGALLYDDYAHHPEEIKATLQAFVDLYPDRRLIAVFHPHTFTRTKALLSDFAQSFSLAQKVVVLDIYGSAREQQGGVSSQDLADLINTYVRGKAVRVPGISEAIDEVKSDLREDDLVVTLGAGNVWEVSHALAQAEEEEEGEE
jgi:UDP-N-acetylmuramate--alanine ligase